MVGVGCVEPCETPRSETFASIWSLPTLGPGQAHSQVGRADDRGRYQQQIH